MAKPKYAKQTRAWKLLWGGTTSARQSLHWMERPAKSLRWMERPAKSLRWMERPAKSLHWMERPAGVVAPHGWAADLDLTSPFGKVARRSRDGEGDPVKLPKDRRETKKNGRKCPRGADGIVLGPKNDLKGTLKGRKGVKKRCIIYKEYYE